MKQVLFEEDGAFRVGTVLSEAGASVQVEAAHGKRSKLKTTAILLRFDGQPLAAFMPEAQKLSEPIDPKFLWEVCGPDEFAFDALARDYFGRAPTPQEAAAVALALHSHPMYFYKRGKGHYQGAPEENLKAALAGAEKKRQQQERVDTWAEALAAGSLPAEIGARSGHAPLQARQDEPRMARARFGRDPRGTLAAQGAGRGGCDRGARGLLPAPLRVRAFPRGHRLSRGAAARRASRASPRPGRRVLDRRRGDHRDRRRLLRRAAGERRGAHRRAHRRAHALLRPRRAARGPRARAHVHGVLPGRQDHHAPRRRHRRRHARPGAARARALALPRGGSRKPRHPRHRIARRGGRHRCQPANRRDRVAPERHGGGGRPRRRPARRGPFHSCGGSPARSRRCGARARTATTVPTTTSAWRAAGYRSRRGAAIRPSTRWWPSS